MKEICDLCTNDAVAVLTLNIPSKVGIKQLITFRCATHRDVNYETAKKIKMENLNVKLEGFHKECTKNKIRIDINTVCGCFYCRTLFKGVEITKYIDEEQTARCPFCGVDSVLAGDFVEQALIEAMHVKYFQNLD